jgi:hypothetical protein
MKKSFSIPYLAAALVVVLGVLAVVPLMGAATIDDINIAGRRFSITSHNIYTVPSGKTLIIQGASVLGYSDLAGQSFPAALTLKCGDDVLIPLEVMALWGGIDPFEFGGELGLVCPADSTVKLAGGPVANADSIGWLVVGQLVTP